MWKKLCLTNCAAIACCLALGLQSAQAAIFTLNATDSGWYDSTGEHSDSNPNYLVGDGFVGLRHNFFVFDLSGVSGTITSATLKLYNPEAGNQGGDGTNGTTRTYNLFDVSTALATLSASNFGAVGIFSDLGSGTNLGSNPGPFSNGTIVNTSLNASGLAYLQSAVGVGSTAIGGQYTGAASDEYLFAYSNFDGTPDPATWMQLEITTDGVAPVPEPSSLLIFGGLAGLFATRLRRKK